MYRELYFFLTWRFESRFKIEENKWIMGLALTTVRSLS